MNSTIKKIIYFIAAPYSRRDHKRFGIDILEKNGFEVEVWDFGPFLYPRAYYEELKVVDIMSYSKLRLFKKRQNALRAISELCSMESFAVSIIPYSIATYMIYKALSRNKIRYSVFLANAIPLTACGSCGFRDLIKNITMREVLDKFKQITFKKLAEVLFLKLDFGLLKISPATLILAGGEKSIVGCKYPVNKKTETLWLHTLDYDIYLCEKEKTYNTEEHLAVFLDEFVPFHSFYLYLGLKPFATADCYYPVLNKFFDHLESNYGVNTIIAAHPRSDYEKHRDYFNGRPVIKGRTAELINRASFVITHASTSINFAVLSPKPIIFVTTDQLEKSPEGTWIVNFASLFGKRVNNLNKIDSINIAEELKINHKLYEKYKNDYIKKTGSEELPFWQIFANKIKALDGMERN